MSDLIEKKSLASPRLKVLLLEDNPDDAHIVGRVLKRSNLLCEIHVVNTRLEFTDALNSFTPDVILSDHALPQFSSLTALSIARKKFPFLPFILVTGAMSDEFAASVIKTGADDYLLKNNLLRLPVAIEQAIQKRQTEEMLVQSQGNLKSIFENTDTAYILLDADFTIVSFNGLATSWVQKKFSKTMNVGVNIFSFSEEDGSDRIEGLKKKLKAGHAVEYETHIAAGAFPSWYHVRFVPIMDGQGKQTGTSLAISDITRRKILERERKRVQQALRKSNEDLLVTLQRFQQVQSIGHLGHWEVDLSTQKVSWSEETFRIYGLVPGSVEPSQELFMKHVHPDDYERVNDIISNASHNLKQFSFFHRIIQAGGEQRNLFTVGQFELDRLNHPTQLYGISLDVTTSTQKEQELSAAHEELNTFIYRTYHDLRGPISSILGLVNVGKAELSDAKSKEYLDMIRTVAEKQLHTLQSLTDVMAIRSKTLSGEFFLIGNLIDEIVNELRTKTDFDKIHFTVKNEIEVGLVSDRELLRSVLCHLLENAFLYYSKRQARPEVHLRILKKDLSSVIIEVEDNGIGMSEAVKNKVFDMFYRGNELSKGSGLGLYVVKNAVNKLGGTIEINSKENVGTIFRFTLPVRKELSVLPTGEE